MGDKISGKAKQAAGKITNNKKMQLEGKADELKGKAKDAVGDARAHMSDKASEIKRDRRNK